MSEVPSQFVAKFNKIIREAEGLICMARDSQLQMGACQTLEELLVQVEEEKKAAVSDGDEDYANLLLGCECILKTLIAELKMWMLLKEERPDPAWDALIEAQMWALNATRAHKGFHHLSERIRRLLALEKLLFPPQVFFSSGYFAKTQECSICHEEYEDCEHLKGKPYMGEFCAVIVRDLEFDHVAVVTDPADKRCRVTEFSVNGGKRNRMTWKVSPE